MAAWDNQTTKIELVRCELCCEGNQINPRKEREAMERWLRKHVPAAVQTPLEVVK